MKSIFDERRNAYNVTITKGELEQAFKSEQELHKFMHEIVSNTYGEWFAEATFPILKENKTMTNEDELFIKKYINITFRNEMHTVNVLDDTVDKIMIQDGFIKLHDTIDDDWHCYNLNNVTSYHYPGHRRIVNN